MNLKEIYRKFSDYKIIKRSKYFDSKWYKKNYSVKGDAVKHYAVYGAKAGYNPSPSFSRIKYELIYDDVRYTGANPIVHYERYGCYEDVFTKDVYLCDHEKEDIELTKIRQDKRLSKKYSSDTENLIVYLVPEEDTVSGGVMSINSIAKVTKDLKDIHNSEVMICTVPNPKTFDKFSKFDSDFDVYRFDQLRHYFKNIKNFVLHIPEIYVFPFLYFLTPDQQLWLKGIENVHINILNQNVDFLPRPREVNYLKELSNKVTMTCAHRKYCVPQFRTSYDIDVHLFSTSNFTNYKNVPYSEKENLLVYSPDTHPMKERILNKIKEDFPDLKMKEIKNMSYGEYLDVISRAKWMITFGEGLDGYFSESLRSGAIAFSIYNLNFFEDSYDGVPNIFEDYSEMYEKISKFIKQYDNSKDFRKIVDICNKIDSKIYDDAEYVENIKQFYLGNYTIPVKGVYLDRQKRLEEKPLISVALASFNGGKYIKEQIESILNQDYPNLEVVVSDDGSNDETMEILSKYKDKIKIVKNVHNHGLNGNFANAIQYCKGEYIALSDQDDVWEPNKITRLLEKIDEFDIVQAGVVVIDKDGNYHQSESMHLAYEADKTTKYRIQDNIIENTMLGCTTLMRADFVRKYSKIPKEVVYHDIWFLYNAILNGRGIVYIDEQLVRYRQHGENTAFLTYNSGLWKDKKIQLDKYMIDSFPGLNNKIKRLFELDINYNILRNTFKECFSDGFDDFLKLNFYNADTKSITKMCKCMCDDMEKYHGKL